MPPATAPSTNLTSSSSSASATASSPPSTAAYSHFSRQWVVPGTLLGTAVGATVGGALSAFYHRPLARSTGNVAMKFGLSSLLYFGTVAYLSQRLPPEYSEKRFLVHAGSGAVAGFLLGGATGRAPGALRGMVLGAALAVPAYFALEGRHYIGGGKKAVVVPPPVAAIATKKA